MNSNDSAFPHSYEVAEIKDGHFCEIFYHSPGLTARQYAAIKLKVPRSGDPDIDAMIQKSRRDEFAKAALEGIAYEYFSNDFNTGSAKEDISQIAHCARLVADAMLAEVNSTKITRCGSCYYWTKSGCPQEKHDSQTGRWTGPSMDGFPCSIYRRKEPIQEAQDEEGD